MSNYIILGKNEDAKTIVQKVYSDNFENEMVIISENALEEIKAHFRKVLNSLAVKFEISIETFFQAFDREQDAKKIFQRVYEGVDILVEGILKKGSVSKTNPAERIMEYIDANYCDNMLSVKKISGELGYHEDYISKLFKKEYGVNLSTVIEQRRIAKACELFKNTDLKVVDVATEVGFNNVINFRKAFKKITGMTPSEYK